MIDNNLLKLKGFSWVGFIGVSLLGTTAVSAQILFDFEEDEQSWYAHSTNPPVVVEVFHSPDVGATSGDSSLEVGFTVTSNDNPFAWAFRVDLPSQTPQATLIADSVGKYLYFDVTHLQQFTPNYNGSWELAAVVQTPADGDAGWNDNFGLLPSGTILDEDFTITVSFQIPDADYSEGLNLFVGAKAAPNSEGSVTLFFDNFRVGDAPPPPSIFAEYPGEAGWKNTSFIPSAGFGWIYDVEYPYVWSHDAGNWLYIDPQDASTVSFYAWHFGNVGWIWSSSEWNRHYWDFNTSSVLQF